MDDKTSQEDEILAMKSIYEDNDMFVFNERTHSGLFAIKHEAHGEKYLIKFGTLNINTHTQTHAILQ